jgi:hypothetical protein
MGAKEPSVEDQEGIPSEQTEVATIDDIALSQQAESASADTAETNTSSAVNVQQADHPYLATQIENFNPQTANTSLILGQLFGVLASTQSTAPPHGGDIILILGQDSAASVEATG